MGLQGAEVDYYPQYMSFYECKQDCNGIGGIFEISLQQKVTYLPTQGSDNK